MAGNARIDGRSARCSDASVQQESMRTLLRAASLAAVIAGLGGCSTTSPRSADFSRVINEPFPLAPEVRGTLGRLDVTGTNVALLGLFRPPDPGEAAGHIADRAFRSLEKAREESEAERRESESLFPSDTRSVGRAFEEEFTEPIMHSFLNLLLSSAAGVVGGVFTGVPQATYQRYQRTLHAVWREEGVQPALNQLIARSARERGLPWADAAGPDTHLEIEVAGFGFDAPDRVNPPLTLAAAVDARLRRVTTGEVLAAQRFEYRSPPRPLLQWADQDGALFRRELATLREVCADVIVRWLGARSP
jgi:hypothetical protein